MQRNIHKFQKTFLMASTALTRPAAAFGAAALALGGGIAHAGDPAPNALPNGSNVVKGSATVTPGAHPNEMNINQHTDRTVIDWKSFDIGKNAHVKFNQPNSNSIAANRVNGSADPTKIHGSLTANGHVWILNPNGVMFGANARVDVSGIVASTANINVDRFMAGDMRLHLQNGGSGSVINNGSITVREAGLAAFVAPHVANNGTIHARLGKVTLASGTAFTLDLAGDRLVEIGLGAEGGLVDQAGDVIAEGGVIEISAAQAGAVVDSIINVTGYTSAASAEVAGGEIILGGGEVNVAGTLDASGATGGGSIDVRGKTINTADTAVLKADATENGDGGSIIAFADDKGTYAGSFSAKGGATGGDGGLVETSGKTVSLDAGLKVNTSALNGDAGTWLIDPEHFVVDAGEATAIVNNLLSGNVKVEASESITVDSDIDSSGHTNDHVLSFLDENSDGTLVIDLNAEIRLGTNQSLTGEGSTVNVASTGLIQNGVDVAATDATVTVDAGTYAETVTIDKNISVIGAGIGDTIIRPDELLETGVGHKYRDNTKTAVFVSGASDVTLSGMTIDGNNLDGDAVVFWTNASGEISNVRIINPRVFDGNQTGQGLAVDATDGNTTNLLVSDAVFEDWNKNAIDVVNGQGETTGGGDINLTVQDSEFIGRGATSTTAQNAIVLWERAGGTINADIDGADISGIEYTGGGASASGILFYGSPNGTLTVSNSSFTGVQQAIATSAGSSNEVDATEGNVFDGIAVADATLDQLFDIENKLLHKLDDAANGLIRLVEDSVFVSEQKGDIQAGVNAASLGDTVNVQDGTYALASALDIGASVSLKGQSEAGTVIDGSAISSGYGAIVVEGDDVTLSDFTLDGPSGGSGYGIKVQPDTGDASDRLLNFNISDVTVRGSHRAELDLNGVVGATINNFTADGQNTGGAGIQITDSSDITLTNVTTFDNDWGAVALYQSNRYYDEQVSDINIDASENSFGELLGLFTQDESEGAGVANLDFGTLNLTGFDYIVRNDEHREGPGLPEDGLSYQFTFFKETLADAVDFALNVNPAEAGQSVIEGWVAGLGGVAGNNIFTVADGMRIGAAVDDARSGANINVGEGTYVEDQQIVVDKDLSIAGLEGGDKPIITPGRNYTGTAASGAWIFVDEGVAFSLSNVAVDGDTFQINQALRSHGNTTISGVDFRNILGSSAYTGFAVASYGGTVPGGAGSDSHSGGLIPSHLTVTDSTFENIGRIGVLIKGTGSTADIEGNDFTGKGAGDHLDYAVEVGAGGSANIIDNTISGNRGEASDGSTSAGILVTTFYGEPTQATIEGNTITDSTSALALGYNDADTSDVTATGNTFSDNDYGIVMTSLAMTTDISGNTFERNGVQLEHGEDGFDIESVLADNTFDRSVVVRQGEDISVSSIFSSIQDGIDAAVSGNIIDVFAGIYDTFGTSFGGASDLTIQTSEGATVDGSGVTGAVRIIDLRADGTTLTGFNIIGGGSGNGVGISVSGQGVTASDNVISDVLTGIQTTTHHAEGNGAFTGNVITADHGISLQNSGNTVSGNTVNAAVEGLGVLAVTNTVSDNTFEIASGATAFALYGGAAASQTTTADNTVNLLNGAALTGAGELAGTGGTVDLEDGTYTGTLNVNHSGVSVLGESQAGTTIDGGVKINAHDPAGTVLSGITLENFTVDAANGQIGIHAVSNNDGVYNTEDLSITDVTVNANNSHGIGLFDVDGATLTDVTVNGNGTSFAAIEGVGLNGLVIAGGHFSGANRGLNIFDANGYEANGGISLSNANFSDNNTHVRLASDGVALTGNNGSLISLANDETGIVIDADNVSVSGMEIAGLQTDHYTEVDWEPASNRPQNTGISIQNNSTGVNVSGNVIRDMRTALFSGDNTGGDITGNVIENTKGGFLLREDGTAYNISGNETGPNGNEWDIVYELNTNPAGNGAAGGDRQAFLLDASLANNGMKVLDRSFETKNRTHVEVDDDSTANAADDFNYGNGLGNERQPLQTIQSAFDALVAGGFAQIAGGTYAESAVATDAVNLAGSNVAVDGLTLNGAGSTIQGDFSSNGAGFTFAPIVLTGNLSLTTTGGAAINTGAINGSAAGGQTLTVNAAGPVSMGSLGATTRLGATNIAGAGAKTLTGSTYNANSLTFSGPVTLTQALTTFNSTQPGSAAGNITFNGDIFGTADGAQSVNFIAGNGAGAKSSNGDVTIQNAGTEAVRLGDMIVNADDFSAATVWLAADYSGTMTGNQTFTDETLNAGGNVDSNVGGNASGPVNSGGNVNMGAGGNVSGNMSGNNVTVSGTNVNSNINATNNANVTAQNTYTGSVNANSGTINANTVDADVNGGTFTVNANSGSVTGNGSVTSGGGAITVNGQKQSGGVEGEFGQIIVEGFVLPEGAIVTDTGDIVLPEGLAIGLISPAAGEGATEPKVVFVRSVQRLGALLAEGYSAIIIDLDSGFSDEEQEMAMTRSDIQDLGRN